MEETKIEPSVLESKCTNCDRFLVLEGRNIHLKSNDCRNDLCKFCKAMEKQAEIAIQLREKRHHQARFNADEEDTEYSPYLIHT